MSSNRTPAGVPTGGQFAAGTRGEAGVAVLDQQMTAREAERLTDDFFASPYGADYDEVCGDAESSRGMCIDVSDAFADYLHSVGETSARTVDMDAAGHEYILDGSPHTVVEVRGMVIDLTHRQFDPDAYLPTTAAAEEFYSGWVVLSRD